MKALDYIGCLEQTYRFFEGTMINLAANIENITSLDDQREREYPVYFLPDRTSTVEGLRGLDALLDPENGFNDIESNILGNRIFALSQIMHGEEPLHYGQILEVMEYLDLLRGKFKYTA